MIENKPYKIEFMQSKGKVYDEIKWKNLGMYGVSESIRHRLLGCMLESILNQHVMEHTRARGGDMLLLLDFLYANSNPKIENIKWDAPLGKSDHAVLKI